jgi:hypothetical protein
MVNADVMLRLQTRTLATCLSEVRSLLQRSDLSPPPRSRDSVQMSDQSVEVSCSVCSAKFQAPKAFLSTTSSEAKIFAAYCSICKELPDVKTFLSDRDIVQQ